MFTTPSAQKTLDEKNRCEDRAWLSLDDQHRFALTTPTGAEITTPSQEVIGLSPT